ncbi:hypothetical protein [Paracoccus thiocyanatus]|uniref:Uncharacterized protein n=1 Tax=Paracoccus thiocyanatus TaxID=34006 RepID=A0A3D8PET2_9RHOB|nr:hypothetical protein [Paracoccus thiocyanatus]RDW14563.1 hypothetical protein DIE28_02155 [Paracoccus thiocyanatus]
MNSKPEPGGKPARERTTYPSDMEGERKEPDGLGHDKPKPSDSPPATTTVANPAKVKRPD